MQVARRAQRMVNGCSGADLRFRRRSSSDQAIDLDKGRNLGFGALGLLDRAKGIVSLFDHSLMEAVAPVVLPLLSARVRRDQEIRSIYLLKLACVSGVAWPFYAFAFVYADSLTQSLLGQSWTGVAPIVRILCVGGLFVPITSLAIKFLIALGIVHRYLPVQLILQVTKLLLVVSFSLVSLELAAAALLVGELGKSVWVHAALRPLLGIRARDTWEYLRPSLAMTVSSMVLPMLLVIAIGVRPQSTIPALACGVTGFCIGWFVGLLFVQHPLKVELITGLTHLRALVRNAI